MLVVGATGSIGRLAVAEAVAQGYATRTLIRGRQGPAASGGCTARRRRRDPAGHPAVDDIANMPLADEPQHVRGDLDALATG